ncbi:myelin basic protein-like [Scleropages formosus]|uniref:Myelin basic protein n=1 Tax=Scleropages formosus TaxID=113540 RepID=A0A8C9VZD5_SCLFO|nr:myelin basic protein-like [Scleropages formosus]
MGQHLGKREPLVEEKGSSSEAKTNQATGGSGPADDNEVFDAFANNGSSCKGTAATDSSRAGDTRHGASAADPGGPRPHLVRLFSRDAPGRQDNTFKDRPSESDELHTIQEQGGAEHAEQDAD